MTSSPLFIIDAELMVIFCPMLQFGCFNACANVAFSMSAPPRCGTVRLTR